ncbi:hypothetical protein HPP92_019628 [Vanilla planifolia]|uniref:Uncharacterized protein n=1 Tax=Vanilla planifolia TaxID=51239 RepID=A0A835Q9C5_VANPL|nr:hypothetical protein HPP92_019628 [Vanilla planifolia]
MSQLGALDSARVGSGGRGPALMREGQCGIDPVDVYRIALARVSWSTRVDAYRAVVAGRRPSA